MKHFICSLFILCFISSATLAGEPDKHLEDHLIRPTVAILGDGEEGTGTVIRSEAISDNQFLNVVLTAAHVTEDMKTPKIYVPGWSDYSKRSSARDQVFEAATFAQNKHKDMALMIFLSPKKMPTAELGLDTKVYIGNEVQRVGIAKSESILETGKVTGLRKSGVRTAMMAAFGYSGGPVYHEGKLIAITQAFREANQEDSFSIRVTVLKSWAAKDKKVAIYDIKNPLPKISLVNLVSKALTEKK